MSDSDKSSHWGCLAIFALAALSAFWSLCKYIYELICGMDASTVVFILVGCSLIIWISVFIFRCLWGLLAIIPMLIYGLIRTDVFTAPMPWFSAINPGLPTACHTFATFVLVAVTLDAILIWGRYLGINQSSDRKEALFPKALLRSYFHSIILIDILITPNVYAWLAGQFNSPEPADTADAATLAEFSRTSDKETLTPPDTNAAETPEQSDENDLVKRAAKGNAMAQEELGDCYYEGRNVPKNYTEAVKWYQKSAEQNNADAEYKLARCYMNGQGVGKNVGKSIFWYLSAANHGNTEALYELACIYKNGTGVPVNMEDARKYAEQAKANGHSQASKLLKEIEQEEEKSKKDAAAPLTDSSASEQTNKAATGQRTNEDIFGSHNSDGTEDAFNPSLGFPLTSATNTVSNEERNSSQQAERASAYSDDELDPDNDNLTNSPGSAALEKLRIIQKELSTLRCTDSDARWAQKRILQLIPVILERGTVNYSGPEMKGNTCLHYACELGSRQLIHWLVENGADVNNVEYGGGNTPLHNAARLSSLHTVTYLLAHGANPDIRNNAGDRPIDVVGRDNHNAICRELNKASGSDTAEQTPESHTYSSGKRALDFLPSVNSYNDRGSNPIYKKRLNTLLPMIADGSPVDVTTVDTKGNTALHYACGLNHMALVRWLLEQGANPNAETNKGATPLRCTSSEDIRRLLREYGAYKK